ncbi:hypothetical protein Anapl_10467 [Anas platyrhynchos]|uniref:Uncharacterized protein n=1 Tax=Anas platyrhynchos TaxID=8839 RepID=R0LCI6_ANAPL|nr:hypothetical protein Anapl_10467 [Anas platyrhynchos]
MSLSKMEYAQDRTDHGLYQSETLKKGDSGCLNEPPTYPFTITEVHDISESSIIEQLALSCRDVSRDSPEDQAQGEEPPSPHGVILTIICGALLWTGSGNRINLNKFLLNKGEEVETNAVISLLTFFYYGKNFKACRACPVYLSTVTSITGTTGGQQLCEDLSLAVNQQFSEAKYLPGIRLYPSQENYRLVSSHPKKTQSFTTGKQCIATECNTTENNTVAYETTLRMEMEHKADILEWLSPTAAYIESGTHKGSSRQTIYYTSSSALSSDFQGFDQGGTEKEESSFRQSVQVFFQETT